MQDVKEITEYIIHQTQNSGGYISSLKLQKILYYAQGHHLASFNEPLFDDEIQAWKHGPVVPSIYHKYKLNPYILKSTISIVSFSDGLKKFLGDIIETYGFYSAWTLRQMTHKERPWLNSYKKGMENKVIPNSEIMSYFKSKK